MKVSGLFLWSGSNLSRAGLVSCRLGCIARREGGKRFHCLSRTGGHFENGHHRCASGGLDVAGCSKWVAVLREQALA